MLYLKATSNRLGASEPSIGELSDVQRLANTLGVGIELVVDGTSYPRIPEVESPMTLNDYQQLAANTAVYPKAIGLTYTLLGLAGEAGELCNKYKKHLRSDSEPDRNVLADELGDVLWYAAMVAIELGLPLDLIAQNNLRKLDERKKLNALKEHA
jgi:NTP pyrophosphatase (non-canonical NTP hydrolase)